MEKSEHKQNYSVAVNNWGKEVALRVQDLLVCALKFIPDGVEGIYDHVLTKIPFLGRALANEWLAKFIKAMTGITLIQMLAHDIGRFLFYPLGYFLGYLLGVFLTPLKLSLPPYRGSIARILVAIAPQTVFGASIGAALFFSANSIFTPDVDNQAIMLTLFLVVGSIFGFVAKLMYIIATNIILAANASTIRKNVDRARGLSSKLKAAAKHKAKLRIVQLAERTIQQINGPQLQSKLNTFFSEHYETISTHAYKKIERHLNYLTDRACHGDLNALRRLFGLVPGRQTLTKEHSENLDNMLERIFNRRAIEKMQDDIDTVYDVWQYRHIQKDPSNHPILAGI